MSRRTVENHKPITDIRAEQCVLGAMLKGKTPTFEARSIVGVDDFYREDHKLIFQAICILVDTGKTMDFETVNSSLHAEYKDGRYGGEEYIYSLMAIDPTASHVKAYAEAVCNAARRRNLQEVGFGCIAAAHDFSNADEAIAEASSKMGSLTNKSSNDIIHISKSIERVYARMEDGIKYGFKPDMVTGLKGVDDLLCITNGGFYGIGARSSHGKSSFVRQMLINSLPYLSGSVLIFAAENGDESVAAGLICYDSKVSNTALQRCSLSNQEIDRISASCSKFHNAPIYIKNGRPTIDQLVSTCRIQKIVNNVQIVIIDYLTLIRAKGEAEADRVTDMSPKLLDLAESENMIVIAVLQNTRNQEREGRVIKDGDKLVKKSRQPALADLRGGGQIEQDLHGAILLDNEPPKDPAKDGDLRKASIILAKNKRGKTGQVDVWFDGSTYEFFDMDKNHE